MAIIFKTLHYTPDNVSPSRQHRWYCLHLRRKKKKNFLSFCSGSAARLSYKRRKRRTVTVSNMEISGSEIWHFHLDNLPSELLSVGWNMPGPVSVL